MNLFGGKPYIEIKKPLDPAYEIFAQLFSETLHPAKYGSQTGDFVQLSKLRRVLGIKPREIPPDWERACRNYLSSPLSQYSLKDLAVRYAVFVRSPLDRFNKPVGAGDESSSERQLRQNKEAVRRSLERIVGSTGNAARGDANNRADRPVSGTVIRLERKTNRKDV